jgi:hypothetical protein
MAGMTRDPLCGVHNSNNNQFSGLGDFWDRKLKFIIYEVASGMQVESHLEFNSEAF